MATTTSRRRSLSLPPFPTLSFFGSRTEAKAAKAAKAEAKAKAEAEAKLKIAEARGRAQARGRADTALKEVAATAAATVVADLKARETEVIDAHPRLRRKLQKVSKQKGENDLGGSEHSTLSVQRLDDSFLSIRYDGKSSASRSSTSSTGSNSSPNTTVNKQEADSKAAMAEQQKRTMALVQVQEAEARAKEQAEMAASDVSAPGAAQPVRTSSREMPRGRRQPPPLMVPQQYPQIYHPQLKHHSLKTEMVNDSNGEAGWTGYLQHSPHKPASLASSFSASVASSASASTRHSMVASMASLTSTATSTTTMAPGGSGSPGCLSPTAYAHAYARAYTHAYSQAQAMRQGKAIPPSPPLSPPGSSSSSVSSSSVFLSGHSQSRKYNKHNHSHSHSSSNSSVSNFSDFNAPPGYGYGGRQHQNLFRGDRHSLHANVVPELSHLSRERQHVDATASASDSPDSGTTQPRRKAKTPVYSIGQLEDNKDKQQVTETVVTATKGIQTPPDSPVFVGVASDVSDTGPGHVRAKSSIGCIAEEYRALLVSRDIAFTDADDDVANGNANTEANARARANMTPAPLASRQRQFLLSTPKKEHLPHSSPLAQGRYEKAGSVSTSSPLPSPLLSPIFMPQTSQLPQTPQTMRGYSPVENLSLKMCTDLLTRELSAAITDRKAPKKAAAATVPALQVLVMIEAYERLRDQLVADAHKNDTTGTAAQTESMLSVWLQSLYRIYESLTQEDGAHGRGCEWDDGVSESLYDSADE